MFEYNIFNSITLNLSEPSINMAYIGKCILSVLKEANIPGGIWFLYNFESSVHLCFIFTVYSLFCLSFIDNSGPYPCEIPSYASG